MKTGDFVRWKHDNKRYQVEKVYANGRITIKDPDKKHGSWVETFYVKQEEVKKEE